MSRNRLFSNVCLVCWRARREFWRQKKKIAFSSSKKVCFVFSLVLNEKKNFQPTTNQPKTPKNHVSLWWWWSFSMSPLFPLLRGWWFGRSGGKKKKKETSLLAAASTRTQFQPDPINFCWPFDASSSRVACGPFFQCFIRDRGMVVSVRMMMMTTTTIMLTRLAFLLWLCVRVSVGVLSSVSKLRSCVAFRVGIQAQPKLKQLFFAVKICRNHSPPQNDCWFCWTFLGKTVGFSWAYVMLFLTGRQARGLRCSLSELQVWLGLGQRVGRFHAQSVHARRVQS